MKTQEENACSIMVIGPRPDKSKVYGPKLRPGYGYDYESAEWRNFIKKSEEILKREHATEAITGMDLGTSMAFAIAVSKLKDEKYPIKLICAVPFHGQEQMWPKSSQKLYYDVLNKADEVNIVSSGDYTREKMQIRDQYMVDRCDKAIALWDGQQNSETSDVVKKVLDKQKPIFNLNPHTNPLQETILRQWPYPEKQDISETKMMQSEQESTAIETADMIRFSGYKDPNYGCFSNFSYAKFKYDGLIYHSSEAAFQAAKTTDPDLRKQFTHLRPGEAKKEGKKLVLRPDWEQIKYNCMVDILQAKFSQNPEMAEKLKNTANKTLIEDTTPYHDNIWGQCFCDKCKSNGKSETSQNLLGKALMQVRDGLQRQQQMININDLTEESGKKTTTPLFS